MQLLHFSNFLLMLNSFSQWMASGSRGPCGLVALKLVEEGPNRETGFVMGPFLEDSLVLENVKKSVAVMKRDVQVSEWEHSLFNQQVQHHSLKHDVDIL